MATIRGFGEEGSVDDASDASSTTPGSIASGEPGRYIGAYDADWFWWWWWNYVHKDEMETDDTTEELEPVKLEIDLLAKNNRIEHKTDKYGVPNLVVRRGQAFSVKVKVNREFGSAKDHLSLIFSTGPHPQASKGTLNRVVIDKEKLDLTKQPSMEWVGYIDAVQTTSGNSEVTCIVRSSANSPAGKYKLVVCYYREVDGKEKRFSEKLEAEDEQIYMLFNAFCKDDQVYLESEAEREEYVLNEKGRIFVGNSFWPSARPWNFGHFSKWSLKAAMHVLQKSGLDTRAHGNPTKVCRAISSLVNKSGYTDQGILVGNWSGKYEGGESPTSWTGSPQILQKYMETGTSVKYGQCWVFSGITTTLGRALGIPTRTVTNFDSAHDHDESLTIDKHFTEEGEPIKKLDDSVWNFHVWNESWFTRPDLPEGHDGWQAYDGTPQELSEGVMQCGPSSVNALKEGNVYMNYDGRFICAEVNGDELIWEVDKQGKMILKEVVKFSQVGSKISTKAVGSNERNDITWNYKYFPGTPAEKQAKERAYGYANVKKLEQLKEEFEFTPKDVSFEYNSTVAKNGDVNIEIKATNNSTEVRRIRLRASCNSTYYTAIPAEELSKETLEYQVEPGQMESRTWSLPATVYWHKVDEDAMIKVYMRAKALETGQTFTKVETFTLQKPELKMEVSTAEPKVGESFKVAISFSNPLAMELKEAFLNVEGPGMQKEKILLKNIEPYAPVQESVTLTPKYPGEREVIAVFHSKQLVNLCGAVSVNVKE